MPAINQVPTPQVQNAENARSARVRAQKCRRVRAAARAAHKDVMQMCAMPCRRAPGARKNKSAYVRSV